MHTQFWSEILEVKHHLRDLDVDGRLTLKCILTKLSVRMWTGFIWFKIGTNGELL
jgi:hypothetical protein